MKEKFSVREKAKVKKMEECVFGFEFRISGRLRKNLLCIYMSRF